MTENRNKNKIKDKTKKRKTAIALKYDKSDIAPRVIAKGSGYVAENIIKKGTENNVEMYEDENLTQELMNMELGQEIPEELYTAVAEVLGFIYNIDKEKGENIEK